ncbi:DgyrCDS9914 [Dimorphilus gyrociliatus]|uniref:DgyrCDS9914 n=1 Tax=Dimorphilus gyrociliatus TaxID=2664684 RepID=A0A7I8W0M8_9ANNE|nr:DgyrCDS9914 [Dimorphilus gyrociliatus]
MSTVTPNKESVQKKIASILTPLKDENERRLRGFQIAKMCFMEGMLDEANKYIKDFLTVHTSAAAYKLQGEILEQLKEGTKALESYKRAFEIDEADNVGVLNKICELGAANKMDENVQQFYREKAEEKEKHNSLFRLKNRSMVTPPTPSTHLFSTSTPTRTTFQARNNAQPSPQNISAVSMTQPVNSAPPSAPTPAPIKDTSNVLEHLVNVLIDQNKSLMDTIKETVDYAVKEMRESHVKVNQTVEKLRENNTNVNKNIDELSDMINSLRDLKVAPSQVKSDENTPKPSPPRPPAPTPVVIEQQNIQPASTLSQINPLAQYALQMQIQSAIQQQATKQNLMYPPPFQNPTGLPEYRNLMYYPNHGGSSMCGGSTVPTQAPPVSNYQFGPNMDNQAENAANSLAALSQMARNQQPLSNPQSRPLAPREPVPLNFTKTNTGEGFKPNLGEPFKPNTQNAFKPNQTETGTVSQQSLFKTNAEDTSKLNNTTLDSLKGQDLSTIKSPEKDEHEDFEPTVSFKPICELPSNIVIKTGEEEEKSLFCHRGKLYRYESKTNEWKERGLGDIKILQHKVNGKSRIICRREQIYKLACNHYITSDMHISKLSTAENSWCWIAQDFADEELKTENFAVRFKLAATAEEFKTIFERCAASDKSTSTASPPKPKEVPQSSSCSAQSAFDNLMKGKEGEWECNTCLVRNPKEKTECVSCSEPKPGHEKAKGKKSSGGSFTPGFLGNQGALNLSAKDPAQKGFAFGSPAAVTTSKATTQASSTDTAVKPLGLTTTTSTTPASAPFKFSFGSIEKGGFVFNKTASTPTTTFTTPQKLQSEIFSANSPAATENQSYLNSSSENPEEHESSAYFEPIVKLDPVEIVTGEENEKVLYKSRAKLYRFVDGEWKERGIGDVKILQNKNNRKCRILMRRDQIHKICLNHALTSDLTLSEMANSQGKAWIWQADDFADEEIKHERFAIRFKTPEIANSFQDTFDKAKNSKDKPVDCEVIISPPRRESVTNSGKVTSPKPATPKEGSEKKTTLFSFTTPTPSTHRFSFEAPPKNTNEIKFNFTDSPKFAFNNKPEEKAKPVQQSNSNSMLHQLLAGSEDALKTTDEAEIKDVIFLETKLPIKQKIELALKYKLPESFFNYENKKSCSGCVGCNSEFFDFSTIGKKIEPKSDISKKETVQSSEEEKPPVQQNLFGEEDEDIIFNERAKLYRFVDDQWKERGVGQMKILKNKAGKYRILLRREQVLKLACNHRITPFMTMDPLLTSETALCWSANDYSESDNGVFEKFSVRFKSKELTVKFKNVFEECKKMIQNEEKKSTSNSTPLLTHENDENDDEEYETEDETELAFEKRVTLGYVGSDGRITESHLGDLTVHLDDDINAYRLQMVNDNSVLVCNHVICQEHMLYKSQSKPIYVEWTAEDFSIDESVKRRFRVTFSSQQSMNEFEKIFTEGIELAREDNVSQRGQSVEMMKPCVYSS